MVPSTKNKTKGRNSTLNLSRDAPMSPKSSDIRSLLCQEELLSSPEQSSSDDTANAKLSSKRNGGCSRSSSTTTTSIMEYSLATEMSEEASQLIYNVDGLGIQPHSGPRNLKRQKSLPDDDDEANPDEAPSEELHDDSALSRPLFPEIDRTTNRLPLPDNVSPTFNHLRPVSPEDQGRWNKAFQEARPLKTLSIAKTPSTRLPRTSTVTPAELDQPKTAESKKRKNRSPLESTKHSIVPEPSATGFDDILISATRMLRNLRASNTTTGAVPAGVPSCPVIAPNLAPRSQSLAAPPPLASQRLWWSGNTTQSLQQFQQPFIPQMPLQQQPLQPPQLALVQQMQQLPNPLPPPQQQPVQQQQSVQQQQPPPVQRRLQLRRVSNNTTVTNNVQPVVQPQANEPALHLTPRPQPHQDEGRLFDDVFSDTDPHDDNASFDLMNAKDLEPDTSVYMCSRDSNNEDIPTEISTHRRGNSSQVPWFPMEPPTRTLTTSQSSSALYFGERGPPPANNNNNLWQQQQHSSSSLALDDTNDDDDLPPTTLLGRRTRAPLIDDDEPEDEVRINLDEFFQQFGGPNEEEQGQGPPQVPLLDRDNSSLATVPDQHQQGGVRVARTESIQGDEDIGGLLSHVLLPSPTKHGGDPLQYSSSI